MRPNDKIYRVRRINIMTGIISMLFVIPFSLMSQEVNHLLITRTLNSKGLATETLNYFVKNIEHPTLELLFEKGNAYFLIADYKNAANCYYQVNQSNNQLAAYELARCYAQMNKPELACSYLTVHLKMKKRNMQSFIKSDDAFTGISKSQEWINLWNTDWYSKYDLMYEDAWYEYKLGNNQEALTILNKLTDIRKSMVQANKLKALVYEKLDEPQNALISINLALARDPEIAEYHYIKSRLELTLEKPKKALNSIDDALHLDSTQIDYYLLKAKANLSAGKQQQAIADVGLLISIMPDAPTLFLSGEIYAEAGEWQLAIKAFNKCIAMEPYNPVYFIARGDAYLKTEVFNFAEKDFSFVLDFEPNSGELYFKRAIARLGMKNREDACSDFNKAYNLNYVAADEYIKNYCRNYSKMD